MFHISEMSFTAGSSVRHMIYELHTKRSMQKCELNLNMIIDENPKLIITLDRSDNHIVIRKYSHIT